jgi:hypothetical protein
LGVVPGAALVDNGVSKVSVGVVSTRGVLEVVQVARRGGGTQGGRGDYWISLEGSVAGDIDTVVVGNGGLRVASSTALEADVARGNSAVVLTSGVDRFIRSRGLKELWSASVRLHGEVRSSTYEDGQRSILNIVLDGSEGVTLGVRDNVRIETKRDGVGRHLDGGEVVNGQSIRGLGSSQADHGRGEESETDHVGGAMSVGMVCREEDDFARSKGELDEVL